MFVSLLFINMLSNGAKWQPKSIWFQRLGLWWVSSFPLVTWASPSIWTGFLTSRALQHQHQHCLVRGSLCTFSCDISNNHLLFLHLSPWISVLPSISLQLQFLDDYFFSLSFLPCICWNLTNKMVHCFQLRPLLNQQNQFTLFISSQQLVCSAAILGWQLVLKRSMESAHFSTSGYLFWSCPTVDIIWRGIHLIPISRPWSGKKKNLVFTSLTVCVC